MKKMNKHITLAALVIAALGFAGTANAAEMFWNSGAGAWSESKWSTAEGGPFTSAWNNDGTFGPTFLTTGGTVNVDATYYIGDPGIGFDVTGYTLSGVGTLIRTNALVNTSTGNTTTISCILGGTAGLTKGSNTGTLVLTGLNTYTGKTSIPRGVLSINSIKNADGTASALGAPANAANGTIDIGASGNAATLIYTGGAQDADRVINLKGTTGGATIDQSGTGLLKFTSANTATGTGIKTLTLQGSTAGKGEIAGAIVDNSGTNKTKLAKAGTGTWTLSGTNTYTGTTTVNAGTLLVNGSLGNTATTVGASGTLGGSGTIGGAVTVNAGGTISPGNSPGTLTVNNATETWAGGGKYAWQLLDVFGTAGTDWDLAAVTGTGNLAVTALSGNKFNVVLQTLSSIAPDVQGTPLNWNALLTHSWKIASSAGAITGWDVGDGVASNLFAIDATNFVGGVLPPTASFSVSKTGNDVYLNYVPEPATMGLLALGGLAVLRRRRK